MRILKQFIFCLAVCLPVPVFADSAIQVLSEREFREQCSEFSQAGMRDCLAEKARESQEALRKAEQVAMDALSKWIEDPPYIDKAKAKFAASNKAFAKYREAQCAFAYSLGGGAIGNALDMWRFACIAELNNRRAEQLRDVVSDLPLK